MQGAVLFRIPENSWCLGNPVSDATTVTRKQQTAAAPFQDAFSSAICGYLPHAFLLLTASFSYKVLRPARFRVSVARDSNPHAFRLKATAAVLSFAKSPLRAPFLQDAFCPLPLWRLPCFRQVFPAGQLGNNASKLLQASLYLDAVCQGPAKQGGLNPGNAGGICVNKTRHLIYRSPVLKKGSGVPLAL